MNRVAIIPSSAGVFTLLAMAAATAIAATPPPPIYGGTPKRALLYASGRDAAMISPSVRDDANARSTSTPTARFATASGYRARASTRTGPTRCSPARDPARSSDPTSAAGFDGAQLQPISKLTFFAYQTLKYGVNVAGGDVDGDGFAEVLTGPGPGVMFGPHLRGFDHDGGGITPITGINAFIFPSGDSGLEAAAGDTDVDGSDEIAAAAGPSPANDSRVALFDDASTVFVPLVTFDPFPGQTHGVSLALVFPGF